MIHPHSGRPLPTRDGDTRASDAEDCRKPTAAIKRIRNAKLRPVSTSRRSQRSRDDMTYRRLFTVVSVRASWPGRLQMTLFCSIARPASSRTAPLPRRASLPSPKLRPAAPHGWAVADSRCQCPLSSRPSGRRCGEPGPAATGRRAGSTTAGGDACILDRRRRGPLNVLHGSGVAAAARRTAPAVAGAAGPGGAARRDRRHRADRRRGRAAHRYRLPALPAPEPCRRPDGAAGPVGIPWLLPRHCPPSAGIVVGFRGVPADVAAGPGCLAVLRPDGRGGPGGR